MRRIIIHGHFYQPPREEPWLELVPREASAAPDHDWNERITRECYAPLAWARLLDEHHRIRGVVNAYAWTSFDVGPTLFRWFDRHAPEVGNAFRAADQESRARLGAGNAMASPYHHIILPLASRRDKRTEVRWGIRDFTERFGRPPEGMWLPETAVDDETLEVLAEEGIRFTLLAPHQVTTVPSYGRPGRWRNGAGRELAIFVYDGALAHEVAFGEVMRDADRWADRMLHAPLDPDGHSTTAIATDGETFGHHHRFGDLALAAMYDRLQQKADVEITNFAAALRATPPRDDLTIVPETSWSCVHGLERWRGECGCRMDPETHQGWRAPLRAGLEVLAQGIHTVTAREWPPEAGDLWEARDAAGAELAGAADLPSAARRLLEAERHALAMFTSCAWFFDDLARLEPRIVLRHAARAIEFLPRAEHEALETALLSALALAISNDRTKGNGVDLWRSEVLAEADGPARLAAGIAAIRELVPDAVEAVSIPTHQWRFEGDVIVTHHRRTGREYRWSVEPFISGVVAERIALTSLDDASVHQIALASFPPPVKSLLGDVVAAIVFEAALDGAGRSALREGSLDRPHARQLALAGAWQMVDRDGLDAADVLLHGVLDLFALDEEPLTDLIRAQAFQRLRPLPDSAARHEIARRFGLALPVAS